MSRSELIKEACQNLTTSMVMMRLGPVSIAAEFNGIRLTIWGLDCCTE